MSIADKLTYLNETKSLLREAINAAGGNLTPETPFREYSGGWLRDQSASLILDFSKQQYVAKDKVPMFPDRVGLEDIVTFTRSTGGGRFNAQGQYEWLGPDEPRIDYDPLTGECLGLLVEEQRTNLLLNSATLATQSVTVTAVARTLSFYGTGSVTLSGSATGTLTGTGADDRVSLTFTPAAGTLTLTVSGSVTSAQLEAGSFPTSYIPTEGAQVARAADIATVNELSPWYNPEQGTLFVEFARPPGARLGTFGQTSGLISYTGNGLADRLILMCQPGGAFEVQSRTGGVFGLATNKATNAALGETIKGVVAIKRGNYAMTADGQIPTVNTASVSTPPVTFMRLGNVAGGNFLNGHIESIRYYPRRLSNTELQALTA